ncbi:hypothetical protein [Desulfonema magnum]|nr:hypothetical protein [Desulfonema magnum]
MISLEKKDETRQVKYNKYTGEAWWASNTSWKKIKEMEKSIREIMEIYFGYMEGIYH